MKVFDAEKFRLKMETLFGGQYISRLVEITGTNRMTVRRWVIKQPGNPLKGPARKYQEVISKSIKEELGITLIWGEFMSFSDDEKEKALNDSMLDLDTYDPYKELLIAKKEINDLRNALYVKEQENIKLRSLLDKK